MLSIRLSVNRVVLIEEISTKEILTIQFNRISGITFLCSEHFEIWYGHKFISIFTAASEMGFKILYINNMLAPEDVLYGKPGIIIYADKAQFNIEQEPINSSSGI